MVDPFALSCLELHAEKLEFYTPFLKDNSGNEYKLRTKQNRSEFVTDCLSFRDGAVNVSSLPFVNLLKNGVLSQEKFELYQSQLEKPAYQQMHAGIIGKALSMIAVGGGTATAGDHADDVDSYSNLLSLLRPEKEADAAVGSANGDEVMLDDLEEDEDDADKTTDEPEDEEEKEIRLAALRKRREAARMVTATEILQNCLAFVAKEQQMSSNSSASSSTTKTSKIPNANRNNSRSAPTSPMTMRTITNKKHQIRVPKQVKEYKNCLAMVNEAGSLSGLSSEDPGGIPRLAGLMGEVADLMPEEVLPVLIPQPTSFGEEEGQKVEDHPLAAAFYAGFSKRLLETLIPVAVHYRLFAECGKFFKFLNFTAPPVEGEKEGNTAADQNAAVAAAPEMNLSGEQAPLAPSAKKLITDYNRKKHPFFDSFIQKYSGKIFQQLADDLDLLVNSLFSKFLRFTSFSSSLDQAAGVLELRQEVIVFKAHYLRFLEAEIAALHEFSAVDPLISDPDLHRERFFHVIEVAQKLSAPGEQDQDLTLLSSMTNFEPSPSVLLLSSASVNAVRSGQTSSADGVVQLLDNLDSTELKVLSRLQIATATCHAVNEYEVANSVFEQECFLEEFRGRIKTALTNGSSMTNSQGAGEEDEATKTKILKVNNLNNWSAKTIQVLSEEIIESEKENPFDGKNPPFLLICDATNASGRTTGNNKTADDPQLVEQQQAQFFALQEFLLSKAFLLTGSSSEVGFFLNRSEREVMNDPDGSAMEMFRKFMGLNSLLLVTGEQTGVDLFTLYIFLPANHNFLKKLSSSSAKNLTTVLKLESYRELIKQQRRDFVESLGDLDELAMLSTTSGTTTSSTGEIIMNKICMKDVEITPELLTAVAANGKKLASKVLKIEFKPHLTNLQKNLIKSNLLEQKENRTSSCYCNDSFGAIVSAVVVGEIAKFVTPPPGGGLLSSDGVGVGVMQESSSNSPFSSVECLPKAAFSGMNFLFSSISNGKISPQCGKVKVL